MTREEAIVVVRKNLPHLGIGATEMTDALGTLIPELCESESEDERIRKALIEAFEVYDIESSWNLIPVKHILAWLEKQKEHHFTKRNALFDKCVENCDPIVMKKVSDEVDEMLEKEQKPAEWSEDSVKYEEGFKAGRESGLRDGQKYVLNNLDSYGLCKPAEWSDEDEKKITFLERLIRYNVPEGEYGWADGHKGGFITKSEAISKLKSLRPSWKPSEVQMDALEAATVRYQSTGLESLYEDLKKL